LFCGSIFKLEKWERALLKTGGLVMTIPGKPRSSKQRHITTETGKEALKTEKLFWMRE
jgi:hypothetical protein